MKLRHDLSTARRIMYGDLLTRFHNPVLDSDRLSGTAYTSVWETENGLYIRAECENIFANSVPVLVSFLD